MDIKLRLESHCTTQDMRNILQALRQVGFNAKWSVDRTGFILEAKKDEQPKA